MEDRITPSLYLELTDTDVDTYGAHRVPEVIARRGVERASWWRVTQPHREGLPLEVSFDGFRTLGLYEVAAGFVPPGDSASDRSRRGLHMRQCPRPGQGVLSGATTLGLLIVLYSARRIEAKAELRDWADFVHLPPLAMGGFGYKMITPYENIGEGRPHFLHLYEMDSADPESIFVREIPEMVKRFGPYRSPGFQRWFVHPELSLDYANTLVRVGAIEVAPADP
jgi:hypothetical protein